MCYVALIYIGLERQRRAPLVLVPGGVYWGVLRDHHLHDEPPRQRRIREPGETCSALRCIAAKAQDFRVWILQ